MIMGTINDGDVLEAGSFVANFQYARRSERRLLIDIGARNKSRQKAGGRTNGLQSFRKLAAVVRDRNIRKRKNFGRRTIIFFELKGFRFGIAFRKFVDVGK